MHDCLVYILCCNFQVLKMPNTMMDFIDVTAPTVGSGTIEVLRNGAPGRLPPPLHTKPKIQNHMWQNYMLAAPQRKKIMNPPMSN